MKIIEHTIVYRNENEFCAWPFNGGMWQFDGGEIVMGFARAPVDYANPKDIGHGRVGDVGIRSFIRSTDGGVTWNSDQLEDLHTHPPFDRVITDVPRAQGQGGPYDPKQDGYMLMCGGSGKRLKPNHVYTSVSTDRGKTWSDQLRLPTWHPGCSGGRTWSFTIGRPSYVVREDGMILLFGEASRSTPPKGSWDGEMVIVVYASPDGGAYWGFLGELEMENPYPLVCTPYPMIRRDGAILCAVRRQYSTPDAFTQIYISEDGGLRWRCLSRVNEWGVPANLVELADGRIVCVYSFRHKPFGIRARISADGGATWGTELVLRDDGGSWDLGYPRTVLLGDGSLLSTYYFNCKDDPVQQDGGVRHIAATRWHV